MTGNPLAIDLFCGLGGWSEGLLAEGYECVGYDIEAHEYGEMRYPGRLVIQDVLTLHGSQFKDAALIVASPPCQEYSYMAMPWGLAKAKAAAIRADTTGESLERLNRLFNACFRIQKEASIAAGHHIPLVVENVRGAQPWVGRARWNFGSFYLWGDVPALMPTTKVRKVSGLDWSKYGDPGYKAKGFNVTAAQRYREGQKTTKHLNIRDGHTHTRHLTNQREHVVAEGRKGAGAGAEWFDQNLCVMSSNSDSRKAASAMIAKIPFPLSRHIAAIYRP